MVNVMKLCKAEFKFIIHHYLNREIVFTWGNWSCWLSQSRNEEIDDSYCSCCSWTLTAELSHLHSSADLDLLQGNTVLFKIPQVFRLVIVCWSGGYNQCFRDHLHTIARLCQWANIVSPTISSDNDNHFNCQL